MGQRVLSIAVHPDDETLGCGATLLKHAAAGDELHWLLVSSAHAEEYTAGERALQEKQVAAVKAAYPFASLTWLRLPATRLEMIPLNQLVSAIQEGVARTRPDTVFVPYWGDSHSDHRVSFDAALGVLKSFYMSMHGVRRVLACEVPSETDSGPPGARPAFVPNVFVDVGATLERKLEILSLYEGEVHPHPGPRSLSSVRALARVRGATVGVEAAEAFMLVREIG